jgi:hypothetical protein
MAAAGGATASSAGGEARTASRSSGGDDAGRVAAAAMGLPAGGAAGLIRPGFERTSGAGLAAGELGTAEGGASVWVPGARAAAGSAMGGPAPAGARERSGTTGTTGAPGAAGYGADGTTALVVDGDTTCATGSGGCGRAGAHWSM